MSSVNKTMWSETLSETKYLRAKEAEKAKKLKLQEWDNDFDVDDENNLYDKQGNKVGKVVDVENAVLEFFD